MHRSVWNARSGCILESLLQMGVNKVFRSIVIEIPKCECHSVVKSLVNWNGSYYRPNTRAVSGKRSRIFRAFYDDDDYWIEWKRKCEIKSVIRYARWFNVLSQMDERRPFLCVFWPFVSAPAGFALCARRAINFLLMLLLIRPVCMSGSAPQSIWQNSSPLNEFMCRKKRNTTGKHIPTVK